ncbi:MAG TPA: glycosyltransferase [Candidatus Nanoarchaeia archaeon]|nr:glycosyltransferase [Candidatus Nanoarchaeia archaeon]
MKVGIVSKYLPEEDGIAIYTAELCRELQNAGIEIVKIGDKESTTANYTVDFKSFSLSSQLKRIVEKEELDLLHVQYIAAYFGKFTLNTNLILALMALNKKLPVVVTFHEVHTSTATIREKVLGFLQKTIAGKADSVMAHTRQQKEYLQMKYRKKDAYFVHMGVTLHHMHKLRGKNILFFGMLNYGKGVEYLIRAMGELQDFRLTVAGKAITEDYEKLLRQAAAENKLGNVKLDIRWVPEEAKAKYLQEADIMAFPYVWAPYQSAAMHNAFSYGIPVVVTDAGAIGEVVKEFICGRVVEQRSPKALAAGIRAVHGNYETYQHGLAKYRNEASWEKTAQRHGEIYNQTLQEYYEKRGMPKHKKADEKMAEAAKDEADIFRD